MTADQEAEAHHGQDDWQHVGWVAAAILGGLDRRRLAHPSGEEPAELREEKAGALEAARRS